MFSDMLAHAHSNEWPEHRRNEVSRSALWASKLIKCLHGHGEEEMIRELVREARLFLKHSSKVSGDD